MMLIKIVPRFNQNDNPHMLIAKIKAIEKLVKNSSISFGISAGLTGPLLLALDQYQALLSELQIVFIVTFCMIIILFSFLIKFFIKINVNN